MLSFQTGKQVPNLTVTPYQGPPQALWDFRQKSHVVLIYDPQAKADTVSRWQAAIAADQPQWSWLNVTVLVVKAVSEPLAPGVYAIDRYGEFMTQLPLAHWSFDTLEREFIYYEACHC